ncbi:PBSX family phage terminase large subunit [Selenomonas dianae]|uniref:PBSX family phage terminase large subunit n=1 Tax=Selenomonas dianae TaxID=135079 RepID=A0ABN0TCK5_9FIRM|nr:PBSX family phage terminase large subunit [Selenomonas dianae]WLD82606.1 PBSX family phage terminase large subunit [Selenomonas dianae]
MNTAKEINPHFKPFLLDWDSKIYFLVGGYGSSKSYHVALKVILKLLSERRTALVVREVYDTIRDSCFSLFREIVEDMGLDDMIAFNASPMQMRFPNGSKIVFKGMDKPAKLKSINNISLIWVEECSELKYAGFKELLGRLRHPTLPLHIILTTNPVARSNWTYRHFFESRGLDDKEFYARRVMREGNTYYHHSVADDNFFLPAEYIAQLDEMQEYDVDLYRIARLGQFGVNGRLVLPQFEVMPHDEVMEAVAEIPRKYLRVGMDFGFESSYNAVVRMAIDHENKWLYLYWEYYRRNMTDDETADALEEFVETRECIKADSAEPKAIRYYQKRGFNMVATRKNNGGSRHSRLDNTRKMKRFRRIIPSPCAAGSHALTRCGQVQKWHFSLRSPRRQ